MIIKSEAKVLSFSFSNIAITKQFYGLKNTNLKNILPNSMSYDYSEKSELHDVFPIAIIEG